jgi:ribonuclease P protein component
MPRQARPEGYSRRHRFTEQGGFGPVIRGSRKVRGQLAMLHVGPAPQGISRLGVALTRRMIPRAVDRNRVRRLAREVFRRHAAKAAGLDVVLMMRSRLAAEAEAAFVSEFSALLDRGIRRGSSDPAA